MRIAFTLFWMAVLLASVRAEANIQIGLSNESVAITSNFDGADIAIFGSIEDGDPAVLDRKGYDIVVVLEGPPSDVVVRRKERKLGIWVNGEQQRFLEVPSSYSIATTRDLEKIADVKQLRSLKLGFENLKLVAPEGESAQDFDAVFVESLARLKVSQNLFLERVGGVDFLSPTLFRARLALPANVPIGHHRARAFLFREGQFVTTRSTLLNVQKTGFEQVTYNLAHRNGLLYGIIAVLVAIATGWLASVVFRKD